MAKGTGEVTRRGFIGAMGAAAAAVAVPATVQAMPRGWPGDWTPFRAAYMAEIERLAEANRARFKAGELRAERDGDFEGLKSGNGIATPEEMDNMPMGRCEGIVAAHFGLGVDRGVTEYGGRPLQTFDGDESAAYMVLACSPHAADTDDNWNHPCFHARNAAAWDLITVARARGMYAPAADELEAPCA